MSKLESPVDIVRLSSTLHEQAKEIEALKEKFKGVDHPKKLDEATKDVSLPAFLLNFYLATQVDLSSMDLGMAVHIPVQITEREGGRKSIFFLERNEEVLAGIYVTREGGIALRFVKRVTGSSLPAQVGDVYCTRITNRGGEAVLEGQQELLKFDPQTGAGRFGPLLSTEHAKLTAAGTLNDINIQACLLWSMINAS